MSASDKLAELLRGAELGVVGIVDRQRSRGDVAVLG